MSRAFHRQQSPDQVYPTARIPNSQDKYAAASDSFGRLRLSCSDRSSVARRYRCACRVAFNRISVTPVSLALARDRCGHSERLCTSIVNATSNHGKGAIEGISDFNDCLSRLDFRPCTARMGLLRQVCHPWRNVFWSRSGFLSACLFKAKVGTTRLPLGLAVAGPRKSSVKSISRCRPDGSAVCGSVGLRRALYWRCIATKAAMHTASFVFSTVSNDDFCLEVWIDSSQKRLLSLNATKRLFCIEV